MVDIFFGLNVFDINITLNLYSGLCFHSAVDKGQKEGDRVESC